jgi:hypothetical protein
MTVVNRLQHLKILLSGVVILLSALACEIQVVPPSASPTSPPRSTATPAATATAKATDAAAEADTAVVLPVYLNVRQLDGTATDMYLRSGDVVTLMGECEDNWCPVQSGDISGWVYRGCLSEVAGELRCEAAE